MQRKPLIKGNLSRLRHLLYQFLLVPLVMFIGLGVMTITPTIWPAAEDASIAVGFVGIFISLLMATVFLVQRLHDAGHSGFWLLALFLVNILLAVVASFASPVENELAVLVTSAILNATSIIPAIIICALPSKRENNPWIKRPEPPDEE